MKLFLDNSGDTCAKVDDDSGDTSSRCETPKCSSDEDWEIVNEPDTTTDKLQQNTNEVLEKSDEVIVEKPNNLIEIADLTSDLNGENSSNTKKTTILSALNESDKNNEILETKDVENNAEEKGSLKEDEEIGRIDENISRPPPPTPRTESILNTTHCNEIQDSDNSLEIKAFVVHEVLCLTFSQE